MRPPSSVMTTPNSSGLSTCCNTRVATDPFLAVERQSLVHIQVGQGVARDDDEGVVLQVLLGLFDAARRAQRRVFNGVDEVDAEFGPVAEVPFDLVGEVIEGDDDVGDAVALEQLNGVLHARLVEDRERGAWVGWR